MEPHEGKLIILPIPSLVATLWRREEDKGSPLTEEEVLSIRDTCPARMATREQFERVRERRGYDDIDPENCWAEWQSRRLGLIAHRDRKK